MGEGTMKDFAASSPRSSNGRGVPEVVERGTAFGDGFALRVIDGRPATLGYSIPGAVVTGQAGHHSRRLPGEGLRRVNGVVNLPRRYPAPAIMHGGFERGEDFTLRAIRMQYPRGAKKPLMHALAMAWHRAEHIAHELRQSSTRDHRRYFYLHPRMLLTSFNYRQCR
jgi:hypothetical protein